MVKKVPKVDQLPSYPVLWESTDTYTQAVINRPDGTRSVIRFYTNAYPEGMKLTKELRSRFGVIITFDNDQPRRKLRPKDGDLTATKYDGNTYTHAVETFFNQVLLNPSLYTYVLVPQLSKADGPDPDTDRLIKIVERQFGMSAKTIPIGNSDTQGSLFPLEDTTHEDS